MEFPCCAATATAVFSHSLCSSQAKSARSPSATFNNDSNPDVVKLASEAGIVYLLLGNGLGSLGTARSFPVGLDGGIAVADLNGDSNLDVVVSGHFERLRSAVTFLYGDGRGNLTPGEFIPTQDGYRPNRLLVGNLQGDSGPEVALAHQQSYNYDFRTVLALFPNAPGRQLPVFGPEMVVYTHIEANEESWPRVTDAALGDFNSDGITDLAVYRSAHLQTELFFGNGRGGFTPRGLVSSGADSTGMITADCNCDGIADVIQPNHGSDNLAVLASDGNGGLMQQPYFYGVEIRPEGAAAADFNQDGLLDVAVANGRTGSVSILINQTGCLRGTVKLTPSTIVLNKVIPKQDEVKAHIRLPDGFRPSHVVSGSIRLNGLSPVAVRVHSTHIEATFDITSVIALIPDAGKRTYANFRLTAQLSNGQHFVGTDRIRIAAK
ncbi:MAG: FG-GAP repeat domain-containing protein [Acidobacteriota bacterium]